MVDKIGNMARDAAGYVVPGSPALIAFDALKWITTIVIASLGISGVLSGIGVGATMIGLTGLSVLTNRFENDDAKKWGKSRIISQLVYSILFGTLAITGVLSAATVGWIMLIPTLTLAGCLASYAPYVGCGVLLAKTGVLDGSK